MATKRRRPIPPDQADYLVLRTVWELLDMYISKPDLLMVGELFVAEDGRKLSPLSEVDSSSYLDACLRFQNEVAVRATNLHDSRTAWAEQLAREN